MDTLAYRVVYDARESVFPAWPVAVIGLLVAILGARLLWYAGRWASGARLARVAGTVLATMGLAWALVVGGGLFWQHRQLRVALQSGGYLTVQGEVYDEPPGVGADADDASWVVVSGPVAHWYRYTSSRLGTGYRREGPGAGGLRTGSRVRIADVGGRIARLEVPTWHRDLEWQRKMAGAEPPQRSAQPDVPECQPDC